MAKSRYYRSCLLQEFKVDEDDEYGDCAYLSFADDEGQHLQLTVTSDFLRQLGQLVRDADERHEQAEAKRAARKAKR